MNCDHFEKLRRSKTDFIFKTGETRFQPYQQSNLANGRPAKAKPEFMTHASMRSLCVATRSCTHVFRTVSCQLFRYIRHVSVLNKIEHKLNLSHKQISSFDTRSELPVLLILV